MRYRFTSGYLCGMLMFTAIFGLVQDLMGLEKFTEYTRQHWIVMPIWFWILAIIGAVGLSIWMALRSEYAEITNLESKRIGQ